MNLFLDVRLHPGMHKPGEHHGAAMGPNMSQWYPELT